MSVMSFEEFFAQYLINPQEAERALTLVTRSEAHAHKCPAPNCGLIWSHAASDASNQEEHDAMHQCPLCGTREYEKWSIEHGMMTRCVPRPAR